MNESIKQLKKIAGENGSVSFTIPDNCQGDGWDGTLTEGGIYMFGNSHFEGEFMDWEQDEVEEWADEILDAVLYELKNED